MILLIHTFSHTLSSISVCIGTLFSCLPDYHPHRDKLWPLQCVKPGLIQTVLFLILETEQQSLSTRQRKRNTHTFMQTETNNHNIFIFFLLFSLFGNCRVNIFIYHITWHDAPKFTLSVYRNTLNITQGLTMDTRLTFCSLHLQQWMTFSRFLLDFFLLLPLTLITLQIISITSKTSWWSDRGIPLCKCHGGLFVLFTITTCIETLHRLDMFLITSFVPLL